MLKNDDGGDEVFYGLVNPLSANPTKWLSRLKQFIGMLMYCLNLLDHFVGLTLKRFNE